VTHTLNAVTPAWGRREGGEGEGGAEKREESQGDKGERSEKVAKNYVFSSPIMYSVPPLCLSVLLLTDIDAVSSSDVSVVSEPAQWQTRQQ
jgi:hypothetical protein